MPQYFRIATEGATTDGRNISRQEIIDMAETYNPTTYGARVWLEHIRGFYPNSDFKAYGDVIRVKHQEVDNGKLGLFAEIAPHPDLIKMTRDKQKIYTSIEINRNFAQTGRAYLVGLGVTDSPASLGTEILQFSTQHPDIFSGRKQHPDNNFSTAILTEGFMTTTTEKTNEQHSEQTPTEEKMTANTFFQKLSDLFSSKSAETPSTPPETTTEQTFNAEQLGDCLQKIEAHFAAENQRQTAIEQKLATFSEQMSKLQEIFSAMQTLVEQMSQQPVNDNRPTVTGGDNHSTDC